MLRSLSSAISGLQNQQTSMDVIGNNIANANTVGYKTGRVTFEESFSQLLQGASRPVGSGGGTNPLQVGLGMSVGSIDTLMEQGNLESTGQVLDLAIQGSAFFGVSDGEGTYYTRNGGFQLDSNGKIVLSTNGMVLQGKMADALGNFPAGTVTGDLSVPFNEQSPAKATEEVQFSRNLNSDSDALGSVIHTQRFLHHGQGADDVRAIYNSTGGDLGMKFGDQITVSAYVAGVYTEQSFIVGTGLGEIANLQGLADSISSTLSMAGAASIVDAVGDVRNGAIQIVPTADVTNLQVVSDNALSNPFLNKALNVPSTMVSGGTFYTDNLRAPAYAGDIITGVAGDYVSELYDANGAALGLENGDVLDITGMVGEDAANSADPAVAASITYADGSIPGTSTTMDQILIMARDTLKLPLDDGTILHNPTVAINQAGTDDGIDDGAIVFRGAKGLAFSLDNITLHASNANNQNPAPTLFNSNASFATKQLARDVGVSDTSISVYDDTGMEHIMTMTYVPTGTPGIWDWSVRFDGKETISQGQSGQITFGQDGSVASFTYDDNSSMLIMDPNNGSSLMRLNLNVGGPGNFQGITQFQSATTVSAVKQDGYTTGALEDLSVDENGYIEGTFSNGTNRRLAQIMLVDFTNPGGLLRISDSVYTASSNSGDPIFGMPGTQSASVIKPGALEMSNVDLAQEFTTMITTQRGYQANARVITVSDSMLEELVSLKR